MRQGKYFKTCCPHSLTAHCISADRVACRFVLDTHRLAGRGSTADGEAEAEGERFLKRYIHYARSRCFPRLSQQAQERLVSEYVVMRDEVSRT